MKHFNFDKTLPHTKKKTIARFFSIIRHNFFDLVLLNFVFTVMCIPVFTIGASYRSLVCVLYKVSRGEDVFVFREFFKQFGQKNLKSTLYTALFWLLFTIIAFAAAFYYNLAKQNVIFYFISALAITCLIVLFMMRCWFFPLFIKTKFSFGALVVNSFILAFANLKDSVFYLLTALICGFAILALLPYSFPCVFVFPFSFTALASTVAVNDKITENFKQNKLH